MKKRIFLFILINLFSLACFGHLEEPKAIIVVLKAQKNRLSYFMQRGDSANAQLVRKDAEEVMRVMRNDFTDHFSFCPVYYVMDTNLSLLKARKLNGILLDNKLNTIPSTLIKPDELYFIVYFGKPAMVTTSKDGSNTYSAKNDVGNGLVLVGADLSPLKKYPGFVFLPEPSRSPAITQPKYNYDSPKFDIYYRGWAKLLEKRLTRKIERKNRKLNAWK